MIGEPSLRTGIRCRIRAVTIGLVEDDDSELAVIAEFLKDNFEDIGSKLGERLAEAYGNEVL